MSEGFGRVWQVSFVITISIKDIMRTDAYYVLIVPVTISQRSHAVVLNNGNITLSVPSGRMDKVSLYSALLNVRLPDRRMDRYR